ncbi:MAG: 3-hydroxy-3-methylglutaryl CoA synthase [Deltaproteobacteria bacterium]|nr:MAG: 3-hydroxy-3-methylglutaryl CoA synthase [Deltaproteobacteria bacterium]
MAGIVSYSAYIPLWRLNLGLIHGGLTAEKAVAGFDEDSVTMAVAAGRNCLLETGPEAVDALFFASTTCPYVERSNAVTVAGALDTPSDIAVFDMTNSVRSGASSLKLAMDMVNSGSARNVLVTASDTRLGKPGSGPERTLGEGAAAFLVGGSGESVRIEGSCTVYDGIMDSWRTENDKFVRSGDKRFIATHGYLTVTGKAVAKLMEKSGLAPKDFARVIFAVPDARRQVELARKLGFNPEKQLQGSLMADIGDTGTAYPLILLTAALEEANAGDRILMAAYGNGCDAFIFNVTSGADPNKGKKTLKTYADSKTVIDSYHTYLKWKNIIPWDRLPFPLGSVSTTSQWRESDQMLRFYGSKCKTCGTVCHPRQRVCPNCHGKDNWDDIRLSDKKAKLFSFSVDQMANQITSPVINGVLDFDGGGRILCYLTDVDPDDIKIGMDIEMSFRKMAFREGIHIYCWKGIPPRG